MKIRLPLEALCGCVLLLAALSIRGAAQTATALQAAPQSPQRTSVCSGQPLCYETSDFAAIITDYRVSDSNGVKVMDMTVRFQNKTNQPLILGYTQGSAMAIDDQGNRYGLNPWGGPNALRGIGQVVGNSIDPKFVVQPGGTGDALFELAGRPTGTAGVTFEHDLTIREITALEGHQFALGGEFPLQFKGLANGVAAGAAASQAVPGQALMSGAGSSGVAQALPACGPGTTGLGTASTVANTANSAAGQNVSASGNSAVATANTTISNFKSMFGRKKVAAAAPAPSAAAGATPCVPANAGAAPYNASGVAVVPAVATAPAVSTTTRTTTAPQAANVSAAVATTAQPRVRTAVSTTTTTKTAAQPAKAPAKKPVAAPPPTTP